MRSWLRLDSLHHFPGAETSIRIRNRARHRAAFLWVGLLGSIAASSAPTAPNYSATLTGGRSVNVDVLSEVSGAVPVDPGSLTVVTSPAHGTAIVADGEVYYTANVGFSGNDTFKYTVADTAKNVSNVATATITVALPASTYTPLIFGRASNVEAVASPGHPASSGPMDGYAYSSAQLGSTVSYQGETFQLGTADSLNALSNTTIDVAECPLVSECGLPDTRPLRFSSLKILATGVNGPQQNERVCLSYDDGYRQQTVGECFTLSLSDWRKPQHFAGESIAATVKSRVTPSGTLQAGPWYMYEYEIPVDPSRTLLYVQTPSNANVIVLAMNLEPVATPTARPVLMTDSTNIVAATSGNFTARDGPVGLGGHGDTYDVSLLGSSVVSEGIAFQIVSPYELNGYTALARGTGFLGDNAEYPVEYSYFSRLYLLGSGYNGDQINQPVVINYADGTKATTLLSFSDWRTPAHFPGETIAISTAYRWHAYSVKQNGPWYAYSYSVPLDRTKKIASVTLPNADVAILGMTLLP